jgi:hypothetical protein
MFLGFRCRAPSIDHNKGFQQMQLNIYLYCIHFHPTCFGPPTGPSSGVSWAASLCRHLAHAVLLYIRVRQGHRPQTHGYTATLHEPNGGMN